ncbi:MAG: hypothetical protein M1826_002324 [Phylliscum demangeonii]|nr:MAG: hypothetical protein M1826_002324 [Phylliscum demangeonii]
MPPRGSLSPSNFSDADFVDFFHKNEDAELEEDVMDDSFSFIHGDFDFPSKKNVVFNNLVPFTEYPLVDAKPDFFDGANPATINPRVCRDLEIDVTETIKGKDQVERTRVVRKSYVTPCRTASYPALPNFFLEAKGPGGTAGVAKTQACYNGVLGARAMNKLRNYARGCLDDPVYDEKTEAITCTYSDGQLKIYTFHITPPDTPGGDPHYYMTLLGAFALLHSSNAFREGASAFRNLRIWASEQRTDAIAAANARADRLSAMPPPPPATLNSCALGTLARPGPSADGVSASHNPDLPTPLSSPLSPSDAPDSMELDAELGPQSADVADVSHDAGPPPPLPFSPLASDAHVSDAIELDAEAGRPAKRARRGT